MKLLIVSKYKETVEGHVASFVGEQVSALRHSSVECECFKVKGKGAIGYLKQFPKLRKKIKEFRPDVIHAHYGLCGFLANLQRRVPVVTTYHGSDINDARARSFSKVSIRLSAYNVFVSQKTLDIVNPRKNYVLLPCGVNLNDYPMVDRREARKIMGLEADGKYVLFAGAFDNFVKNAPLAKKAVFLLPDVKLLELKGYTRKQVALLMQAVDCFLMTSHSEGSPQVVKEAMACGCPIVSVDVGDVRERIEGVDGCYVTETRTAECLASSLRKALVFNGRTEGRQKIVDSGLENAMIVERLIGIYEQVKM